MAGFTYSYPEIISTLFSGITISRENSAACVRKNPYGVWSGAFGGNIAAEGHDPSDKGLLRSRHH